MEYGVKQKQLSQWVLQFFGLHSSGNAIAIMAIFKPYRQTIILWFRKTKRFIFCQKPVENWVTPLATTQSTSSGAIRN